MANYFRNEKFQNCIIIYLTQIIIKMKKSSIRVSFSFHLKYKGIILIFSCQLVAIYCNVQKTEILVSKIISHMVNYF